MIDGVYLMHGYRLAVFYLIKYAIKHTLYIIQNSTIHYEF